MAKMAIFSASRYVVGEQNVTNFTTCLKDLFYDAPVSFLLPSCFSFALGNILKSNQSILS